MQISVSRKALAVRAERACSAESSATCRNTLVTKRPVVGLLRCTLAQVRLRRWLRLTLVARYALPRRSGCATLRFPHVVRRSYPGVVVRYLYGEWWCECGETTSDNLYSIAVVKGIGYGRLHGLHSSPECQSIVRVARLSSISAGDTGPCCTCVPVQIS